MCTLAKCLPACQSEWRVCERVSAMDLDMDCEFDRPVAIFVIIIRRCRFAVILMNAGYETVP